MMMVVMMNDGNEPNDDYNDKQHDGDIAQIHYHLFVTNPCSVRWR